MKTDNIATSALHNVGLFFGLFIYLLHPSALGASIDCIVEAQKIDEEGALCFTIHNASGSEVTINEIDFIHPSLQMALIDFSRDPVFYPEDLLPESRYRQISLAPGANALVRVSLENRFLKLHKQYDESRENALILVWRLVLDINHDEKVFTGSLPVEASSMKSHSSTGP